MSKINLNYEQNTEMLDEYDFSQGVRGKYYQKYQNNNLPTFKGVQFLTDNNNRRTGVFIDLKFHLNLINDLLKSYNNLPNLQFLTDNKGEKIALILNFKDHLQLWQNIYDNLIGDLIEK